MNVEMIFRHSAALYCLNERLFLFLKWAFTEFVNSLSSLQVIVSSLLFWKAHEVPPTHKTSFSYKTGRNVSVLALC